jgi:tetratricopeptide (TPR) repeat protein
VDARAVLALAIALASGLAWATAAPAAFAEERSGSPDVARAEAYASEAFDAYARKDYSSAIALYQKALDAAPSADIIYNMARIYDTKLKNRGLAIEYYRRYTEDTSADPNRLRVASARLNELRALEALAVEQPAPNPPPAAAAVAPPAPAAPQPTAAPASRGLSGLQVAGIVTGAAGLAGVGLGIAFGFKAKDDAEVADRFCDGNACTTQRGVDASHDASDAAMVSTIAFIAGGALTLLGVTAVLLGTGSPEREVAGLTVTPYAGADKLGAQLAARW